MHGHVARKRDRYYAVIYEGLDPVTGKERRSWHPAGTDRTEAAALVARLAAERDGRNDEVRSLTFGAYLIHQWLPAKLARAAGQHPPQLPPQGPVELPRFGGHLILGETLEEGGPCGSSSEVPRRVPS